MSFKMRTPDGQIIYRAMGIDCKQYHAELGTDGICVSIRCIAKGVKPECQMCSLVNAVKPQHEDNNTEV